MNKSKIWITGIVITALLMFIVYTVYLISKPIPLEIQGEVEATEIKVGSKIAGRIDSLPVYKGQDVDEHTLLFIIKSPEIDAKLQQAYAVREAAQAQNEKAFNGTQEQDIQAAFNTWQKAKAASQGRA